MARSSTPAVEGWFTTGEDPHLVGSRCTTCGNVAFPPLGVFCADPACAGTDLEPQPLSRRGVVWSYTDAQYQPPPPYVRRTDPYVPFALAAVELPEGLVVLGQVADGYGVADLRVGAEVELVVEPLFTDDAEGEDGGAERTIWRWKPVVELGAEADR